MKVLSDLTLDQLRQFSDQLTSITVAGFRLEQDGLAPRFDLTPGMPIRITLGVVMPLAERPDFGAWLASQPQSAEPASADAEPVDAPLAVGDRAEGAPISAEPSRATDAPVVASADSGGEVGNGSGSRLPAAPLPGSASALAAQTVRWVGEWTADQDDMVVEALASAQIAGTGKADALRDLGARLGRTTRAVEQRAYRIAGKIKAEVARRTAQTEAPSLPAAAEEGVSEIKPNDVTAHLVGMIDKGGWSLQRDIDLMELSIAGWPAGDIALEIQMQASAIKPRFDALTGLHDDEATGKKVRRWTREQVLEGLRALAQARAA